MVLSTKTRVVRRSIKSPAPRVPGASLVVRREGEQCESTGPRLERREGREAAPEAGSAGRETSPAGDARWS